MGATTQYLEYFDSHANIPGGNEFISLMFNLHILTRQLLPEQAAADGEDDQASGGDDAIRDRRERAGALQLPGHCPTLSVRLGTLLRTTLPHRRDRSRLRRTAS